jgi:hypothetical protein
MNIMNHMDSIIHRGVANEDGLIRFAIDLYRRTYFGIGVK